ncbi:MAG TPA: rhodanese-like domain-containing protein [Burkholderiales bacterium]|nr:rhodanese-like domain-containing protein [Burkholderiales bacterium]
MKSINPKEAFQFLKSHPSAVLIDVRSEIEYLFVGHPVGSIHVAWNDGPEWEINPDFVTDVKKIANESRAVLLICRSGVRSLEAGQVLEDSGFKHVYNVLHGFEGDLDESHKRSSQNGWRFDNLPWEQC